MENAERPSLDDEPIERTGSGQTDKVRWGAHNAPARADADRWAVHVHEDDVTAAVCDGHGVAGAAHWGREIAAEAASMLAEGLGFEAFQSLHEERYDETVGAAFENEGTSFGSNMASTRPGALPAEGGCTATVVNVSSDGFDRKMGGRLALRHQERDGSVRALTRDHAAATHREEGLRIEKAGGAVEGAYVAAPRAEGLLQVTRSLGDRAHHLDDVVLATPEVVSVSVEDAAFAVVATDGVWAFVDDSRAASAVADALFQVGRRRRGRRGALHLGAGAGRGVAARRR